MNTFETYATCHASGRLVLEGLPFPAGALLEVLVVDQSHRPEERVESRRALMRHVREPPNSQTVTDQGIAAAIAVQRSRRP